MDLNIKPKTTKLLDYIEETFCDQNLGKDFLATTLKA